MESRKQHHKVKFRLGLFMGLIFSLVFISCNERSTHSKKACGMDWKLFRGNAGLSGYTSKNLPENPELLWTYKTSVRTVSSPVINQGTTYWSDKRGHIYGVDLSGNLTFDVDLKTAVEATPMIFDSVMYIGRIDGKLTALSLATQDTLWNYETMGQISASPNIINFSDRKEIVFGSYDNYFYTVDSRTGELKNRLESGYYINGAAALWKNSVLFGGCDSWLRMLDCKTGAATDSLLLDAYIPSSPAIMGDYCYVADYTGNIYEVQFENGKIARHKKLITPKDKNSTMVSVPALDSESLYDLSDDQYLRSVDRKSGAENWKVLLKGNTAESSPLVCNNKLIVCTKTGIVSIHDAQKGTQLWEFDTGENIVASPAVIKKHFMILTAKGTLFCFGEKK